MMKSVHMRIPQDTYDMFKTILEGETITSAVIRLMKQESYFYHNRTKDEVRIVEGKRYDTSTANFISEYQIPNTQIYMHLYQKEKGELFIHVIKNGYLTDLPDILIEDYEIFGDYLAKMPVTEDVYKLYKE